MASSLVFHHEADAFWQLYARALRKTRPAPGRSNPSSMPPLEANLYGASSDPDRVRRYASLCGFSSPLAYPITWPHILAFPLHLRLLTDPAFPLPLLGLVHLRNRIVQHREIHRGENLDIRCRIANPATTPRGLEFDLCSEVFSSGSLVWEESSTTLFRQKNGSAPASQRSKAPASMEAKTPSRREMALPSYSKSTTLAVPESIGRRYGHVSGDINPIHLHALSARAFGFPRAIAHGMWTKARCLALLQQQPDWLAGPVEVDVNFKKPLFLPGKATLNWEREKSQTSFQLLNGAGNAPHLSGTIRAL